MKANPKRTWLITLRGRKPAQTTAAVFSGTYDDALSEADVMECHVRWQVLSTCIEATE
jgi:hypothetical protein